MENFKKAVVLIIVFALGILSGILLEKTHIFGGKKVIREERIRLFREGTHLANPLLLVEGPAGSDDKLETIKSQVEALVKESIKGGEAEHIAFYLRDLSKGTWVGMNEDEKFTAASLGKVPILLLIYMKAQQDPGFLKKEIKYDAPIAVNTWLQHIPPKAGLQVGGIYTIDDLLHRMIANSDNNAMFLLAKEVDLALAAQLFADLRLEPSQSENHQISAKSYATYFRILYNGTYLNAEWSQKALELLTETDFREGLVAGVPGNITVAHKFGERVDGPANFQLHDCGIIYDVDHPYLLCVMTRGGHDFDQLKNILREISRTVYEGMEKTGLL